MKVLQVHCTYQYLGGEDSVVASERALLQEAGVIVEELNFSNVGSAMKKVVQAPFNIGSYRLTKKKIREFKPDIIHIHNLHFAASSSVIYAIKKSGVPYVQTLHNFRMICPSGVMFHNGKLFLDSMHQKFPWSAVKAGVYRNSKVLTGWLALSVKLHQWMGTWQQASKYIVLTDHAKRIFLESGIGLKAAQIAIKPNFSTSKYIPSTNNSGSFVFIGRLSEEKGISVLLKAFASLPHKLLIAGDGPMKADVLTYARKYANIEYVGKLSRDEVFPFLAAGAALIFPSTWYEGMPITIIEAFASGLPVIASKIGAMEEMIVPGYNGLHFETGQTEDLKNKVNEFHALSQDQQETFRKNAYSSYLQHYTPEKNIELLLRIYNDVIAQTPSPTQVKTAYATV
ncbi:MAG: glycosyltransferase [Chitinophagaceae bacterium]